MNKNIRIVFMGTPEFAVESLKKIIENGFNVVGVITSPDKPAGRGQKIIKSDVKLFAEKNNLHVLQPTNLKSPEFLKELLILNPDLQIVVAFRMLPEQVWNLPKLGTFNLHASLLPNYRGAAPINWAIINGEKSTGITTFFLNKEIDTGKIIYQQEIEIKNNYNAKDLHDILMIEGSKLVIKTIKSIISEKINTIDQNKLFNSDVTIKQAPKIFTKDCKINWENNSTQIYNFVRGLSPYPSAWTEFNIFRAKIFKTSVEITNHNYTLDKIITDNKTYFKIAVKDGFVNILELQISGKKRNNIKDFLRGFKLADKIEIKDI